MIINLPKDLEKETTHRYGPNSFKLHRWAAARGTLWPCALASCAGGVAAAAALRPHPTQAAQAQGLALAGSGAPSSGAAGRCAAAARAALPRTAAPP